MRIKTFVLPAFALGIASFFLSAEESRGYVLNGAELDLGQRDFRIFNNFDDATANNNQVPHPNFPGHQGAVMAIWKASVEWGSGLHGDGLGDPQGPNPLGTGQANFDPTFQGEAFGTGNTNSNVHSALSGGDGSVFAFAEGPYSDGWRVRYLEIFLWQDGPTNETGPAGWADLQGIATHEYGHCIGFGHSGNNQATMKGGTATGIEQRSINIDDVLGLQDIYGTITSAKPLITSIGVDPQAGTITVNGSNFAGSGNELWFTRASAGGQGVATKALNLNSNGTTITTNIPADVQPGDVLVKIPGNGHDRLSNAWPVDPATEVLPDDPPTINSVTPPTLDAVRVDVETTINLNGENLSGATGVIFDGVTLNNFPPEFTVVDDTLVQIIDAPLASTLGPVDIEVIHPDGNVSTTIDVVPNDPPVVELAGSSPSFLISGAGLDVTMGSDVGDIVFLQFSGDLIPSSLPGFVDFGIGNNFSTLFSLGTYTIGPTGYVNILFPLTGSFAGVTLHFQCAVIDVSGLPSIFPVTMTNIQTGTFLF